MGMDVYGQNASTEEGAYFRANIWAWPAILGLIKTANEVFNLSYDTTGWDFNDGQGLQTQEECDTLADAMQKLLDGAESPTLTAEHSPTAQAFMAAVGGSQQMGVKMQAETDKSHAQEFINFLRGCGGFIIC